MNDLERARKFEYRHCRVRTGFNVDFIVRGEMLHGVCRDLSDTGIRVKFDGSVVVGSSGSLILHKPAGVIKVEAYVAYAEKGQVGLSFIFKTTSQHGRIIDFVPQLPLIRTNEDDG